MNALPPQSSLEPLVAALGGFGNLSLPSGSPAGCVDAMIEARCVIAGVIGHVEALCLSQPHNAALAALLTRLNDAHQQPLFEPTHAIEQYDPSAPISQDHRTPGNVREMGNG